jgi:hypothetical protein
MLNTVLRSARFLAIVVTFLAVLISLAPIRGGTQAQTAYAAGPTTLSRTPWQMYRAPVVLPVPNYGTHGNVNYYSHAPAIPPVNDPVWVPLLTGQLLASACRLA